MLRVDQDFTCVLDVRATAKINQITITIDGAILALYQFFDIVQLDTRLVQSTANTRAP